MHTLRKSSKGATTPQTSLNAGAIPRAVERVLAQKSDLPLMPAFTAACTYNHHKKKRFATTWRAHVARTNLCHLRPI